MDQSAQQRALMAGMGAASALALYGLVQLGLHQMLQGRALLAAVTLLGVFSGGVLVMTGPIALRAAANGAAGLAVAVTALVQLCALRFADLGGFVNTPLPIAMIFVLITLPLPFWIAQSRGSWRDYDLLFEQAWSIALRAGIAGVFVGVVWLLILLFDLLLSLVGLTVIETLLKLEPVPYLITGAALGLGLAVVQELSDHISPHLILRLLRLLLPVTLVVVVVFLLALPFKGLSNLFGGLSVGFTLLSIVAVGATLITAVVDQRDAAASGLLRKAARALAVLVLAMAILGAVAVYLRVAQYGWSPERIFAAMVAVIALGYGTIYAGAGLRPGDWMARIRQGNVTMALATLAMAALALTPILNAERLSTNSQMARFADGRSQMQVDDIRLLKSWGVAGAGALASLSELAKQPGQDALASRLTEADSYLGPSDTSIAAQRQDLADILLPAGPATTDFIATIEPFLLPEITQACRTDMATGGKGCAIVVADFLPLSPGSEAVVFYLIGSDLRILSLAKGAPPYGGEWRILSGDLPEGAALDQMIRQMQRVPPAIEPANLNQLPLGNGAKILVLPPQ